MKHELPKQQNAMQISSSTTIGSVLKYRPESLEAITSISKKFEKLRNPILRKLVANRTTIAQAARMGNCSVDDFYNALAPLGFLKAGSEETALQASRSSRPSFLENIDANQLRTLDVRPLLQQGHDPLKEIMQMLVDCKVNHKMLKLITDFEPTPLIQLLSKKGYASHVDWINADLVHTYFYKTRDEAIAGKPHQIIPGQYDDVLRRFGKNIRRIDVRDMEKPKPMMTILNELDTVPSDHLLFVYHKRFPAFLIEELKTRNLSFVVKENGPADVHVLIFKP